MNLMYSIPSDETIGSVLVTEDVIYDNSEPEVTHRDVEVPGTARMRTHKNGLPA